MVDQLHQTPLKISILSLLLNSKAHREALMKVPTQERVAQRIIVDQFNGVVSNITTFHSSSFHDRELPEEGRDHNRALDISMKCMDDVLA